MPNYKSMTIIGHVGRDPESREVGADAVTSFTVAVNDRFKKDAPPMWVRVSAWGKLGNVVLEFVKKGAAVHVTGDPSLREYQGQDGMKRVSLELRANDVVFLPSGKPDGERDKAPAGYEPAPGAKFPDDDIPF